MVRWSPHTTEPYPAFHPRAAPADMVAVYAYGESNARPRGLAVVHMVMLGAYNSTSAVAPRRRPYGHVGRLLAFDARTIPVLDIIHVLSYVWEAAGLFESPDAAHRDLTRKRLLWILQGEVRRVIRGLRRMGTNHGLAGADKKDLDRICGYLEKNAGKMRYDEYLACGYPIASGVIERACRHLVKDRMERSGMRWTLEGARQMLHLRAEFQSDYWRTFLDRRIVQETDRIHRHRSLLSDYQPFTLGC